MIVTVRLNHTIVAAHDKEKAALFLTEILGLSAPALVDPFAIVQVSDDTSMDYVDIEGEIASQHYAFLVDENEFDEIFGRIRDRHLPSGISRIGPTLTATSATRSTRGMEDAGSTLTTRAATCWKSSPVHTAAVVRQHHNLIRCSRNHWIPKITRIACLISKRRVVEAGSLVGSDRNRTSTLMREGRGPTNRKE